MRDIKKMRLELLDFNFQRRTNEHNSLLVQLNQQVYVIENLLIPRKEQLELRIAAFEEQQNRQKNR
ncbi:unnamed protein product [Paramecium sonneborni]|uniref:Uncharacterized protein n=1 Tax=Paramecium sonneborni TaxID=65129 RepID=A0A8S1RC84_9CILI|nr:unnamed protein product [Paramecium sonneborni]